MNQSRQRVTLCDGTTVSVLPIPHPAKREMAIAGNIIGYAISEKAVYTSNPRFTGATQVAQLFEKFGIRPSGFTTDQIRHIAKERQDSARKGAIASIRCAAATLGFKITEKKNGAIHLTPKK